MQCIVHFCNTISIYSQFENENGLYDRTVLGIRERTAKFGSSRYLREFQANYVYTQTCRIQKTLRKTPKLAILVYIHTTPKLRLHDD